MTRLPSQRIDPRVIALSEQLRALSEAMRRSVPRAGGIALVGVAGLVQTAPWHQMATFVGLVALALAAKLGVIALYERAAAAATPPRLAWWRAGYRTVILFHGCIWGVWVWHLFPISERSGPVALALASGIVYGAIEAPAFAVIDWVAGALVLLPVTAPLLFRLLVEGGGSRYLMVYLIALFSAAAFRAHWVQSRREQLTRERSLALRPSEAFLDRFSDMASMGAWEVDVDSGFVRLTERSYRLVGLSPDTPLSMTAAIGFLHESVRDEVERLVMAAIEKGGPFELEVPLGDAGPERRWFRLVGRPESYQGRVVRVLGLVQDVTKRRSAEEKERERIARALRFADALRVIRDHADADASRFYESVTARGAAALGAGRAGVFFFDATREALVAEDVFDRKEGEHARAGSLEAARFTGLDPEGGGVRILAAEAGGDPFLPAAEPVTQGGPSLLIASVRPGGVAQGVIVFAGFEPGHVFAADDEQFATALATTVALFRENEKRRRAEAELSRESAFRESLRQATLDLLSRDSFDDLLRGLVERATHILDSQVGEIVLGSGDGLVLRAATMGHPAPVGAAVLRERTPLIWRAFDERCTVTVPDYSTWPERSETPVSEGRKAVAAFPIVLGSECLGVLSLGRTAPGHVFSPDDIRRGELLAQHAALILHNVGIYDAAVRESEARTVALRESEDRFRRIFEESSVAIALTTMPEGRVVTVNDAGVAMSGYPREVLVGRTTGELGFWPDEAARQARLATLVREGRVEAQEGTMRRPNGETAEVLLSATLTSVGGVQHGLWTIVDISERRRVERAMRAFRSALDQSTDAVYIIEPEGLRFIDFNETAYRSLRYTREEHAGLSLADIEAPGRESVRWWHDVEALRRAGQATVEDRFLRKDGSTFPVELNIRFIDGPKAVYMVAVVRDITRRKKSEIELRESEERFRAVFDHSPLPVALLTIPEGRIVDINQAAVHNFGFARADAVGFTSRELSLWAFDEERERYIESIRRQGHAEGYEARFRRRDGAEFPAVVHGRLVGIGGEILNLVIIQDVTEAKRAEAALSQLNADLETRIAERTSELEQARLQAEQANRAKSQFLANMSHEIRTPLNGVLGMLDFLKQTRLEKQQAEMTTLAYDSAQALLGIIEDVLDFSKIEAGMIDIERLPFSIAEVAERACELLNPGALQKDVELTLFTDPALPPAVLGDAARLSQILHNIVGNAIKFSSRRTPPRRVSLRAIVVSREGDDILIEIRIADNGIGMDDATKARLFTAFTQADASITRRFGGTGLGLSISQNLAHLMGGRIDVRSQPGEGATFTVLLPFRAVEAPAPHPEPDLTGLSCIVVGPAVSLAPDLAAYLKAAGARVEYAPGPGAPDPTPADSASIVIVDAVDDADPGPVTQWIGSGIAEDRVIVVRRGRRRMGRPRARGGSEIDGNVLKRWVFLNRVALAAGRSVGDSAGATGETPGRLVPVGAARQASHLILVAEDNELNQMVIRQQLVALGHAADVVPDGRAALAAWGAGQYALIITDLQMPEMDGYELTSAIRRAEEQNGRTPIPIVALTANAVREELDACESAGMNDCMTKPMTLERMKSVLDRWLPDVADVADVAKDGAEFES
jgi:PAS domain S-box-containing protein